MTNTKANNKYFPSIGIECHIQLKTRTKLFAAVGNDARDAAPNTLVSHICLGMPGALPVLNEKVIELASRIAFAFNTVPQKHSIFERKHYFYPDLPKGYQITQLSQPIIVGGEVKITVDDTEHIIRLNRAQIEEDAGKNTHPQGKDYSLVDLNRAGTPLLEIVSEPDIHTPEQAKIYAKELYLLARYTNVSDADLFHGNMRFDVNVSLSPDPKILGTRTETKNLNSFRSVEKAAEYEIKRQTGLLDKGQEIIQETRGWDDAKQKTFSQRGKEEAHDYRYFPDPDLPPVELEDEYIEKIRSQVPILPEEWRRRLASLGLDKQQIETLIDAEVEDEAVNRLSILETILDDPSQVKVVANLMVNVEIPLQREGKVEKPLSAEIRQQLYAEVYDMLGAKKLSSTNAKALLSTVLSRGISLSPLEKYAQEQGFIQVSDEAEIAVIVKQVLEANPQAANDVKEGEMKAIGFLVGQVMKESQGQANPGLAQSLIKKQLELQ